jgi:hypothetical protein
MKRDDALPHDRVIPLPRRPWKYTNNNQLTMATGEESKGEVRRGREGGRRGSASDGA